ncbi:hypothetical protein ANN_13015 [Periplaneta americana]|uniref:Uncharacterized protein n=1 Tax=Periplaneta americana TaxID=6978 RepID=A0ABQ8TID1_PERAM|nr:hypothetical protein ANN_13015 [Periplaneta americana]
MPGVSTTVYQKKLLDPLDEGGELTMKNFRLAVVDGLVAANIPKPRGRKTVLKPGHHFKPTVPYEKRFDKTQKEDPNPLIETVKALLQDQLKNPGGVGPATVSGMLQNFMQSDGGRNLGDMLMGAAKSNDGANAADILSGLGSILANTAGGQGKSNEGGIDPQLIGQMVSMFANQAMSDNGDDNVDVNNNEIKKGKSKKAGGKDAGVDWESMIGLATSFMAAQGGGGGGGWEGFLNMLPVLLGAGDEGGDVKKIQHNHHQHKATSYLPPFMETLYDYWEHFKSSELGQTLWHNSGLEATVQIFTDKDGHFEMERIFGSLENASFRRRWVKSLTSFVAEWIAHVSDPATQTR